MSVVLGAMRALTVAIAMLGCGSGPSGVGVPVKPLANTKTEVTALGKPVRVDVPGGVLAIGTDGGSVAVLDFDGNLIGLSLSGAQLYRYAIGKIDGFTNLVVLDGVALVMAHERVVAIDARTGELRWTRVAAEMDMFTTTIYDGVAWIDGDGGSATIEVRTGKELVRKAPARHERVTEALVDDAHFTLSGARWHVDVDAPRAMLYTHVELGDAVVYARGGAAPAIVAVDVETGAERWTHAILATDSLRYAFRGPHLIWVWLDDGAAMQEGDMGDKWLAFTVEGRLLGELALPTPDVRYCSVALKGAVGGDVLAVAHGVRAQGSCATAVVDIYAQ